jgi:hypothetical protein
MNKRLAMTCDIWIQQIHKNREKAQYMYIEIFYLINEEPLYVLWLQSYFKKDLFWDME